MKSRARSERVWAVGFVLLLVSFPVIYVVAGAATVGRALLLAPAVLFIGRILLAIQELRRRGARITPYPHFLLVASWVAATLTLAALFFAPTLTRNAEFALRIAVITAAVVGAASFAAAYSRARPPKG